MDKNNIYKIYLNADNLEISPPLYIKYPPLKNGYEKDDYFIDENKTVWIIVDVKKTKDGKITYYCERGD
jgi:hypothetical protein